MELDANRIVFCFLVYFKFGRSEMCTLKITKDQNCKIIMRTNSFLLWKRVKVTFI